MPRDIPLGNGSLLVNFDRTYQLRDIYWPHVGQENHTAGHPFRFGVWVDGAFRWVADEGWTRTLDYEDATLLSRVELRHPDLGVRLECRDAVDFHENLYLRRIEVHNESDRRREVRFFFPTTSTSTAPRSPIPPTTSPSGRRCSTTRASAGS